MQDEKDPRIQQAEQENKRTREKIRRFLIIIECLNIRKDFFESASRRAIVPKHIRALWKIRAMEIEMEIQSKEEFVTAYQERLVNTKFLEKVILPKQDEAKKD
jgi:hypothetical protein